MSPASTTAPKAKTTTKPKAAATTKRRATAAKRTTTARKTAATKRAATARKAAPKAAAKPKATATTAQSIAERVVLVPVGAALSAYDRAASTVSGISVASPSRENVLERLRESQKQLDKDITRYERRGTKARNNARTEIKKTRTKVEKQLSQRRATVEREIKSLSKQGSSSAPSRVVEAISSRVEQAVTTGQFLVGTASERLSKLAR